MRTACSPPSTGLRLAFCNSTRKWGGVKTWTIEFAAMLRELGHSVVVYGRPGPFVERAGGKGLDARPVHFGPDYNPLAIARFYREFREQAIDLVLVNVGHDFRTAGIAARLANIPLVQRIGLPGDLKNSFDVRLMHRLLRPHYLCPCAYIRDGLIRNLPFIRQDETSVVYSAKTPAENPPAGTASPLRICSSSQIVPNKGHVELAHTLARLRDEGFAFHWHIAGDGPALPGLKALCADLDLEPRVTFHGFIQDVPGLLRRADVFVLSSYVEGLPNSLLEALAQGLVPVARAVGGVRECWPDSLPELIVPHTRPDWAERDWAALPSAELPLYAPLKKTLSAPPQELLRWKKQAWQHCRDKFSLRVQAALLADFFLRRTRREPAA